MHSIRSAFCIHTHRLPRIKCRITARENELPCVVNTAVLVSCLFSPVYLRSHQSWSVHLPQESIPSPSRLVVQHFPFTEHHLNATVTCHECDKWDKRYVDSPVRREGHEWRRSRPGPASISTHTKSLPSLRHMPGTLLKTRSLREEDGEWR